MAIKIKSATGIGLVGSMGGRPLEQEVEIIADTITAGTAFAKDECGWWGDVLYRSLIDANVYTPDDYPAGWEVV